MAELSPITVAHTRASIEAMIETLIGALDLIDTGSEDLEDDGIDEDGDPGEDGNDDEPELGWTIDGETRGGQGCQYTGAIDGEIDGVDTRDFNFDGSGHAIAEGMLSSIGRRYPGYRQGGGTKLALKTT